MWRAWTCTRASAKYYDIWHEDYNDDVRFFLKLAERTGGPVLECMSGTGRVLIPFAEAGYDITGVDRSPAMLDVCATKVSFLPAGGPAAHRHGAGRCAGCQAGPQVQARVHPLQLVPPPPGDQGPGGRAAQHPRPPRGGRAVLLRGLLPRGWTGRSSCCGTGAPSSPTRERSSPGSSPRPSTSPASGPRSPTSTTSPGRTSRCAG